MDKILFAIVELQRDGGLRKAIQHWAENGGDSQPWGSGKLGLAEALVRLLHMFVHSQNVELKLLFQAYDAPSVTLQAAIAEWFYEKGFALTANASATVCKITEQLLAQMLGEEAELIEKSCAILAQPGTYFVDEGGFTRNYHEENGEGLFAGSGGDWRTFAEQIDILYNQLPNRYSQGTFLDRIKEVLRHRRAAEATAINNLAAFQTDVLTWMRAIALIAETLKNGSHREKAARLRGLLELIETSVQSIRDHQGRMTEGSWQRPDLFRSDYPVQRYRDQIKDLERELARLKGQKSEPAEVEDIPF